MSCLGDWEGRKVGGRDESRYCARDGEENRMKWNERAGA